MKTTIIPAQITTVEDKIAGNLSLTQIMLLLTPLFITACLYTLLPEKTEFTFYKIPFIMISFLIFFALAVRIKGKIIISWLNILLTYLFRPHLYLFDKNDLSLKDTKTLFEKEDNKIKVANSPSLDIIKVKKEKDISTPELVTLDAFFKNPKNKVLFKFNNLGELHVAYQYKK